MPGLSGEKPTRNPVIIVKIFESRPVSHEDDILLYYGSNIRSRPRSTALNERGGSAPPHKEGGGATTLLLFLLLGGFAFPFWVALLSPPSMVWCRLPLFLRWCGAGCPSWVVLPSPTTKPHQYSTQQSAFLSADHAQLKHKLQPQPTRKGGTKPLEVRVPAHAQPPDSGYNAVSDCDSDPVAVPVSRSVSASSPVSALDCGFGAECHSHSASDSVAVSPSAPASASAVSLVVVLIRMRLVFDSGLACHAQKKKKHGLDGASVSDQANVVGCWCLHACCCGFRG